MHAKVTVGAVLYQPLVPSGAAGLTVGATWGPRPSIRTTAVASEPSEERASTTWAPSPVSVTGPVGAERTAVDAHRDRAGPVVEAVTVKECVYHRLGAASGWRSGVSVIATGLRRQRQCVEVATLVRAEAAVAGGVAGLDEELDVRAR